MLRRGVCMNCKTCQWRPITRLSYWLCIAPIMFLIHASTMGGTWLFVKRCPCCRHLPGRHKQAQPVLTVTLPVVSFANTVPAKTRR